MIPAIVLAGSRPGPDPLLTGSGVSTKALLPIAGHAMLVHVVRALRASPLVGPITILAQNSAELGAKPELAASATSISPIWGRGSAARSAPRCPPEMIRCS